MSRPGAIRPGQTHTLPLGQGVCLLWDNLSHSAIYTGKVEYISNQGIERFLPLISAIKAQC